MYYHTTKLLKADDLCNFFNHSLLNYFEQIQFHPRIYSIELISIYCNKIPKFPNNFARGQHPNASSSYFNTSLFCIIQYYCFETIQLISTPFSCRYATIFSDVISTSSQHTGSFLKILPSLILRVSSVTTFIF